MLPWRKRKSGPSVRIPHHHLIEWDTDNTSGPARAVRKANKELAELVSSREDHLAKVDAIQTKYSELLHDMKRLERDHAKSRKRADQLQKEKDQSRSEMQKAVTMKHKLETLCRELQKENKRIKVYYEQNYHRAGGETVDGGEELCFGV